MRELYIYYRVRRDRADAARRAVHDLQASLRAAHPGLVTRLLHRDDDGGAGPATWMETYAFAAATESRAGVDAALEAAISAGAAAFASLLDGRRHVEAFDADTAP